MTHGSAEHWTVWYNKVSCAHCVSKIVGGEDALGLLRKHKAVQQLLQRLQQRIIVPGLPLQPIVARLDCRNVLPSHANTCHLHREVIILHSHVEHGPFLASLGTCTVLVDIQTQSSLLPYAMPKQL